MLISPFISCLWFLTQSSPPPELYSPLVPQKILATTNSLPSSIQYPQYTTTTGDWPLFPPDTWTSGFFPATLYALNTRESLCGGRDGSGLDAADWLSLGRRTSAPLASLTRRNTVGHDVGFLSFPYLEELKM